MTVRLVKPPCNRQPPGDDPVEKTIIPFTDLNDLGVWILTGKFAELIYIHYSYETISHEAISQPDHNRSSIIGYLSHISNGRRLERYFEGWAGVTLYCFSHL